jgi:hypothetical protein
MLTRIAALLLALLVAVPAAAQQFPQTLPYHSVYGRIGAAPGDTGPGQAIPFATLSQQLNSSLSGGVAKMFPHVAQTSSSTDAYTAVDPYGNAISCTGTNSQCLQEFLTATTSNGWPAAVYCQGTEFPSGSEPIFINTTVQITVPVAQDWSFHSYGCNLNINVTTSSGLVIDSEGASEFDWDGKIVYNVTSPNGNTTTNPSCAVLIHPTTHTQDGFAGLYAKRIRIGSPVVNPVGGATATAAVCVNNDTGSTIQQTLWFDEVNGTGHAVYGFLQFGNTVSTGFKQNYVHIGQSHGFTTAGINLGFNGTNGSNNKGNIWDVPACNGAAALSRCFDTWGSNDQGRIGQMDAADGGMQYGIVFETGANNNNFTYGNSAASTNAFVDNGTCNSVTGPQGSSVALWGTTSGCTKVTPAGTASGTLTAPSATDQLIARATTDTLTNKTYDTAGTGNVFKINGTAITAVSGNTATVATTTGALTSTHCVNIDASGNLKDSGSTCGGAGGSPGGSDTQVQYNNSGAFGGAAGFVFDKTSKVTLGVAGTSVGGIALNNATSGSITINPATGALGTVTATLPANTGTIAELNLAQTWTAAQTHNSGTLKLAGATSGTLTVNCAGTCGTNTLTLPAGTTDFSATGGTSQVVKQTSSGGAFTVGQLQCSDLSNGATGCSTATGTSGATLPLLNGTNTWSGAQTFNKDDALITAGNSTSTVKPSGLLCQGLSSTGNTADAGPDTLQSCTVPANTLDAVGRGLHVETWGVFAANGNTKTVTVTWGGTTIYTSTALTGSGLNWYVWCNIYKTGANAQTAACTGIFQNTVPGSNVNATAITDTSSATIVTTGTSGSSAANDIVSKGQTVMVIN